MEIKNQNYSVVLDTNVILHHSNSIFRYQRPEVIIPLCVIHKLDDFKTSLTSLGKNASTFLRKLENLAKLGDLNQGITLENGTKLIVYHKTDTISKLPSYFNKNKTSNQVLLTCLALLAEKKNIILISNDLNLRIRAKVLKIQSLPFEEQNIDVENIYCAIEELQLTQKQWQELQTTDAIEYQPTNTFANQYYFAKKEAELYLFRFLDKWKRLHKVSNKQSVWNIKARNLEQAAAINLLLDEKIPIVFLAGKAGTGKTLLALAAAIEQLFQNKYNKILVSRPFVPMGRDIGYLPGGLVEKMNPWMQPLMDVLEFIESHSSKNKYFATQDIIDKKKIELEALTYIRGKSIPNRFILIDESQNLTPHEIKTIITRVGEKSKIVFTGDPYQIDNPYVDTYSNGLSYVMGKFKHSTLAGMVSLVKGERSQLAELAANLL